MDFKFKVAFIINKFVPIHIIAHRVTLLEVVLPITMDRHSYTGSYTCHF
jgi:hypothetical protein